MESLYPTTRLKFIAIDNEMKELLSTDLVAFSKKYGLEVPTDWPMFPEAFTINGEALSTQEPWCGYLFIDFKSNKIIGNGGYHGEPDENDQVEIGYEIAPQYQNKGYATEAAGEMISFALVSGMESVIAHTLAQKDASNSVLKKLGMEFEGEVPDDELGKKWLWRISA